MTCAHDGVIIVQADEKRVCGECGRILSIGHGKKKVVPEYRPVDKLKREG